LNQKGEMEMEEYAKNTEKYPFTRAINQKETTNQPTNQPIPSSFLPPSIPLPMVPTQKVTFPLPSLTQSHSAHPMAGLLIPSSSFLPSSIRAILPPPSAPSPSRNLSSPSIPLPSNSSALRSIAHPLQIRPAEEAQEGEGKK
jgi:hypothetical protein